MESSWFGEGINVVGKTWTSGALVSGSDLCIAKKKNQNELFNVIEWMKQ